MLNTPVPRLIDAVSRSPSASVTVCTSCSRLALLRVSVELSSSLPVLLCQMFWLWLKVTWPVALSTWIRKYSTPPAEPTMSPASVPVVSTLSTIEAPCAPPTPSAYRPLATLAPVSDRL